MKTYCGLAFLAVLLLFSASLACAQGFNDVLGTHDMTPMGKSPIKGRMSAACQYCHAPHSGMAGPPTPLWNQQLSRETYNSYGSSTYRQAPVQPPLGSSSKLCLSCHDGTVAPGQTIAYGRLGMAGSMKITSKFGTDLQNSHPFSLHTPLAISPEINVLLTASPARTADPTVNLIKDNVECTTCHDPHVQTKDRVVQDFLVRDSSSGQLCLACHDPNRVINGSSNYLSGWAGGIHATASNATSNQPYIGGYGTVALNGCSACHMPHNAGGPVRLLRGKDEQSCIGCHSGGSNLKPVPADVYTEFVKTGHPFPTGNNLHERTESAVLNNNRHATCVDCHNPHATLQVASFPAPPEIRASQNSVVGINSTDGMTVLSPAVNQYESCLRCHGASSGKVADSKYGYLPVWAVAAGDPLNVIPQFSASASSSHPVTHDRTSVLAQPGGLAQPSLRGQMLKLDGTAPGRGMGTRILCTDCHNSDDNRESGGSGPNGPHGSKFSHILERRYEFSQAPAPGQTVANLFPNPDLSVNGPYALCGKCHDLSKVIANTSFSEHARHLNDGFSCSACHTAHGLGGQSAGISGERLVNFDINVVAPNGGAPLSYSRTANSCTLVCHNHAHQSTTGPLLRQLRVKQR